MDSISDRIRFHSLLPSHSRPRKLHLCHSNYSNNLGRYSNYSNNLGRYSDNSNNRSYSHYGDNSSKVQSSSYGNKSDNSSKVSSGCLPATLHLPLHLPCSVEEPSRHQQDRRR